MDLALCSIEYIDGSSWRTGSRVWTDNHMAKEATVVWKQWKPRVKRLSYRLNSLVHAHFIREAKPGDQASPAIRTVWLSQQPSYQGNAAITAVQLIGQSSYQDSLACRASQLLGRPSYQGSPVFREGQHKYWHGDSSLQLQAQKALEHLLSRWSGSAS